MAILHAYLKFSGNAEAALTFYKSVFSGEFLALIRYKDNQQKMSELSDNDKEKIFFIALTVGHGTTIMATDVVGPDRNTLRKGNNSYVYIGADSLDEGKLIFSKLAEGGKEEMPFVQTDWGAYFGVLEDKFGVAWMVNFQEELGPLSRRP